MIHLADIDIYLRLYEDLDLQKDFSILWSINDGENSWTSGVRQRRRQGTKPASAKVVNCSYSSSYK